MEQKSNKKLYIIIGLSAVLVLCMVAIFAALFFGAEKDGKTSENVTEEKTQSSLLGEEVEQETAPGAAITIVIGGFKVAVPEDYGCFHAEGIGPVIYMDDVFQMKLKVVDGTYEEAAANPDKLTAGTTDAGGSILQDVKEETVNGKDYLYYVMELGGQKCYVVYTRVGDGSKRMAGQIAMESETVTDEDILRMFDEITAGAVETDEPDTDAESLLEKQSIANRGEIKTESTLSIGDSTVTFRVPEGYYGQGQFNLDDTASEYFLTDDYAVEVDCRLMIPEEDGYETAKQYVELMFDWMSEEVQKDFSVQEKEIEGTTYYFYNVSYEDDGTTYKEMVYAADAENGGIYAVTADSVDDSVELTEEAIIEFLMLK